MSNNNTIKKDKEFDAMFSAILRESIEERSEQEQQRFTQQVISRLPRRRRHTVLSLLYAYIQSPFWLTTAVVVCLIIAFNHADSILAAIDFNSPKSVASALMLVIVMGFLFISEIIRDTLRMCDDIAEDNMY